MRQYNGSLPKCKKCKNRWILWMIQGDFNKWNRIIVEDCLTFPVNLQWFQAAKDCALDTCNQSDYRKTFLVINFLHWFIPKSSSRNSVLRTTKRTRVSSSSCRVGDTFPKRWQFDSKIKSLPLWFPIGSNVMDQRSGDGWLNRGIRDEFLERFSKFRDAGREDVFCSEQDHPEFSIQEEGQSRGLVSTRKTDRLHDLRILSSNRCAWCSIRLCWFILCHSSWRTKTNQQNQRSKKAMVKPVGKSSTKHAKTNPNHAHTISIRSTSITFHQTEHILVPMLCCVVFEGNDAVIKMITKRSPLAGLRIPAWQAALKRWRKGCRNKKEAGRSVAKSEIYSDELVFTCSWQVPHLQ